MPELRVTITEKFDKILDELVEAGLFLSKADIMRYATINYLKELGWIGKKSKNRDNKSETLYCSSVISAKVL